MKNKRKDNREYAVIDGHKIHVFKTGNQNGLTLVFLSGSATVAPVLDFKILYEKLVSKFRVIVIEKFGYGYSDLYEGVCGVDSAVSIYRQALEQTGEKGPFVLLPHSMSGLEAVRWKQKYPKEVSAVIGLDMAVPGAYLKWEQSVIDERVRHMERFRRRKKLGLLFGYRLSYDGLDPEEAKQKRILWKKNVMNPCFVNEVRIVLKSAAIVDEGGEIACPILMFLTDGAQTWPGWFECSRDFAKRMNAKVIELSCGHYIHHYESERISREVVAFLEQSEN